MGQVLDKLATAVRDSNILHQTQNSPRKSKSEMCAHRFYKDFESGGTIVTHHHEGDFGDSFSTTLSITLNKVSLESMRQRCQSPMKMLS
jgi:hypothetical protein